MKTTTAIAFALLLHSIGFSVEKSDFYLGGGFRVISPDIAKYAKHPIQIQLGYIHDIPNTQFNIGLEAQAGLGGSSNETDNEFIAFWKLQLDSRYDLKMKSEKVIPFVNLSLSFFNVGFENNVHKDALAVDRDDGVYVAGTKIFPSFGFGILFVLPNEDKGGINFEYTYSNYDYTIAKGNPLGLGISVEYLF